MPSFVAAKVPNESNIPINDTLTSIGSNSNAIAQPFLGNGAEPQDVVGAPATLRVLHTGNSAADDLLLQAGNTDGWDQGLANWAASPCYGDSHGHTADPSSCPAPVDFAPRLIFGSDTRQDQSTATSPMEAVSDDLQNVSASGDFYGLDNEFNTDATKVVEAIGDYPYYNNGWLQNLVPFDADGNGDTSLLMNDLNNGRCGRLLDWVPSALSPGLKDRGVDYGGCDGVLAPYQIPLDYNSWYWQPQPLALPMGDFTGDGRTDILEDSGDGTQNQNVLQPTVNIGGNQTAGAPVSVASLVSPQCPYYVADLYGDGRQELIGQDYLSDDTCGATEVVAYDPFSGKAPDDSFTDSDDSPLGALQEGTPPRASCSNQWNPMDCVQATDDYDSLYFGDFNGDGLQSVIIADNRHKTLTLRWNTGNGFGPPVDLGSPVWMAGAYSIQVADINHSGRDSLIVFHEQPQRTITMMISNGDGTFGSDDILNSGTNQPADPGLRTLAGWTGQALGDFNGQGDVDIATLVGDPNQTETGDDYTDGNEVTHFGGQTYQTHATLWTLTQPTYQARMPGGSSYTQPRPDLLATVSDEGANYAREQVSYSSPTAAPGAPSWTDKSESAAACAAMEYPQRCLGGGLVTVRSVTSNDTTANTPSPSSHTVYYSYERPVVDMRGRGFLGFEKVRVWDPSRLQQTVTIYDNTDETGTHLPSTGLAQPPGSGSFVPSLYAPGYYPGAQQPTSVTTITAIPSAASPQTLPALPTDSNGVVQGTAVSVNARISQTVYNTHLVQTDGGKTYVIEPDAGNSAPAQITTQWEASVEMNADVNDPTDQSSDYLWGLGSYPLVAPNSAVTATSTVLSTCDATGNDPGGAGNAMPCIDAYGNVTATSTETTTGTGSSQLDGRSVQTVATFNDLTSGSSWLLGQPASVTVTDTEADAKDPVVSRETAYDYTAAGLLQDTYTCQQVTPAAGDAHCGSFQTVSTDTLGYDQYGNVTSDATTAQGPDGKQDVRQVDTEYDPVFPGQPDERIFPSQSWTPVDYPGTTTAPSAWQAVQPAYGVVVATEDVNGVQSTATYDDQGRPLTSTPAGALTTPATGAATIYSYAARTDTGLGGNNGLIITTTTGNAGDVAATDSAGRILVEQHSGFNGALTDTSYQYDVLGRLVKTSRPYLDGASPQYFATSVEDGLDRPIQTTTPGDKVTKYSYTFFTTQEQDADGVNHQVEQAFTTDPSFHRSVTDTDVDGDVIASGTAMPGKIITLPDWQMTSFHYQPFGLQDVVKTPAGTEDTTGYNTLGRITGSFSPDTGTITNMSYDGFGELLSETHKESGAVTTYQYDPSLGRQLSWKTTEGSGFTSANFSYDTALNGLGKLAGAVSSDGVSESYTYDRAGRQSAATETVDGASYTTGQTYNNQGLPAGFTYPSIGVNTNPGMTLTYNYNANGYLSNLTYQTANPNNQTVTTQQGLWQINAENLDGSLANAGDPANGKGVQINATEYPDTGLVKEITATPGASPGPAMDLQYAYYQNGQLQTRTDTVNGRTENYGYDAENRLSTWALGTCTPNPTCIAANNSPDTKTSTYTYDGDGNIQNVTVSPSLGAAATVTQSDGYGPDNTTAGPGSSGGPHAIDTQTNTNGTSTITTNYTYDAHGRQTGGAGRNLTYNACNLPTKVTTSADTWTMTYGPFCDRASKSGPDGTTVYIGSTYQQRTTPAGVQNVFDVAGVGQVEVDGAGKNAIQYQVTDSQGSTSLVVDGPTGTADGPAQFYDPFGAQINADGTAYTGTNQTQVTQGYTGQEQDTQYGLDNYHGREYDPALKRFTTPDPKVSNPLNGQTYNPYSYVADDPVNATDPTGLDCVDDGNCSKDPSVDAGYWTNYQPGDTVTDGDGNTWTLGQDGYWRTSAAAGSASGVGSDGTLNVFIYGYAPVAQPGLTAGFGNPPVADPADGPTPDRACKRANNQAGQNAGQCDDQSGLSPQYGDGDLKDMGKSLKELADDILDFGEDTPIARMIAGPVSAIGGALTFMGSPREATTGDALDAAAIALGPILGELLGPAEAALPEAEGAVLETVAPAAGAAAPAAADIEVNQMFEATFSSEPVASEAVEALPPGTATNTNPSGGVQNCVACAVAYDLETRTGQAWMSPADAPGGVTQPATTISGYAGAPPSPVGGGLEAAGEIGDLTSPGGGGIVMVYGETAEGEAYAHAFNVENSNGIVSFVDPQGGGSISWDQVIRAYVWITH